MKSDAGTDIRNVRPGIYYLSGNQILFPTQIIVIKELEEENHAYLRVFARYMSVGLTPEGMRKMFCIEAMVIAGRPVLIALRLTIAAAAFMI